MGEAERGGDGRGRVRRGQRNERVRDKSGREGRGMEQGRGQRQNEERGS